MNYLCSYENCTKKPCFVCKCELVLCLEHGFNHIYSNSSQEKKCEINRCLLEANVDDLKHLITQNLKFIQKQVFATTILS